MFDELEIIIGIGVGQVRFGMSILELFELFPDGEIDNQDDCIDFLIDQLNLDVQIVDNIAVCITVTRNSLKLNGVDLFSLELDELVSLLGGVRDRSGGEGDLQSAAFIDTNHNFCIYPDGEGSIYAISMANYELLEGS